MKSHIKTLKAHNAWRRGGDSAQGSQSEIGIAIDECVKAAERYELVRTLTPREFKQLWMENLRNGTGFDGLVDALVKARAR